MHMGTTVSSHHSYGSRSSAERSPRNCPSITDLTTQTGLPVGTVRRAIDILVKEGLVQIVPVADLREALAR